MKRIVILKIILKERKKEGGNEGSNMGKEEKAKQSKESTCRTMHNFKGKGWPKEESKYNEGRI